MSPILKRLVDNWVYGGFLAGVLMLGLLPLFLEGWPLSQVLVVLLLPAYMLHQYEEHDDGRFGRFINGALGNGKIVLSDTAIFVVNIFAVWALYAVTIWLARRVDVGLGLIAVYTTLINAVVHIAPAVATRRYNPGLVTAIVLFVPLGIWALCAVLTTPGVGLLQHAIGLAAGIAGHAVIVASVVRRRSAKAA